MRLLWLDDDGVVNLTDHVNEPRPYAILSHTWGEDEDEVTYQDIKNGTGQEKLGRQKLEFCARRTKEAGISYFWIDTCCIDKRNDAELSTAIRSMFRWYNEAVVCFVYLSDVSAGNRNHDGTELWLDQFRDCRWFKRGWTLQELLAPKSVQFYAGEAHLGDRAELCQTIHEITGIDIAALQCRGESINSFSHLTRLRWAKKRETKLPEDLAYCLAGLCQVSMSPRYGEGGEDARRRLERKITKHPQALQEHYGFFWIKGKAGAGKSVLVKFLELYVQKTISEGDISISFYFNARGDPLEQSFAGMYRSLLSQLLLAIPELQSILDDVKMSHIEAKGAVELLQGLMLKACLRLGNRRLYCFIDALDECAEQDVFCMIDFFQDLGQSVFDASGSVFVCFASRHFPVLNIPTGLTLVLEDTDQHAMDLRSYAKRKLVVLTAKQSGQIMQDLILKATGVFLWVVLVVDMLNKEFTTGRVHNIKKRLSEIPQGLTELFKEITMRHQDNIDEHLLCLRWIMYAMTPLSLPEFYFAMLAGLDAYAELEWDPEMLTEEQMLRFLSTSSKGLAELTKGEDAKVQFIHESIRDFLMSEDGLNHIEGRKRQSAAQSNEMLKQICVRGMRDLANMRKQAMVCLQWQCRELPGASGKSFEYSTTQIEDASRFPFLDYATNFVFYHSEDAALEVQQYAFLQNFNLDAWLEQFNFSRQYHCYKDDQPLDLVYLCAERDLVELLTILADRGHDLETESDQFHKNALFAAFANRSEGAARLLLERLDAIDVDEIIQEVFSKPFPGFNYHYQGKEERWEIAIRNGHEALALFLFARGESRLFVRRAVQYGLLVPAAGKGCRRIVKLLLEHGVDVNVQGGFFGNALQAASSKGYIEIVTLLLENGANVNAFGGEYNTALHAASSAGRTEIVDLLLKFGADVNARKCSQDNASQAALPSAISQISWLTRHVLPDLQD